jgi:transcriptional regulator with PAS, ATPase and Fis domain
LSYKKEILVKKRRLAELIKEGRLSDKKPALDQETLIAILDNVYKGIACVDIEGRITFLSRSNEKFYNLEPGEAIGKHITEVIKNSRLHIVAKTGKPEIGHVIKVKDGQYRVVERFPIKRDGKVIGAIGKIMFHDIERIKVLGEHIKQLENEVFNFRQQIQNLFRAKYAFDDILGKSRSIERIKEIARKSAKTCSTILIQGESGTGKELLAHAIHNASPRRHFPFVRVNCASIPPELFESEFFGYEQGAFTGASRKGKQGLFQLAHLGTIFLDEVSELPLHMQAKLLRVLQEKEVVRVGSEKAVQVDFRLITSTNKNLGKLVASGRFREDLFYRLNVITLRMPPLRERMEDLEMLVTHFISELNANLGSKVAEISEDAWRLLRRTDWKGNVRELRNILERALTMCQESTLRANHIQSYLLSDADGPGFCSGPDHVGLKEAVRNAEKEVIRGALESTGGNKRQASRVLGISRSGLYQKISEYNI